MGISLGSSKLGTIAEMNVVPLIDILLVLLVIFMMIRPKPELALLRICPSRRMLRPRRPRSPD